MCGVGHFMVKALLPGGQVLIDPFTGQSLSREELSERLLPFLSDSGSSSTENPPLGLYLQAALPREIVARMLRNLKEVYRAQQDTPRQIAVLNRLVVLLPDAWDERRDRGLAHAECGHTAQALDDLEHYLANAQGRPDIAAIAERVRSLRNNP